MYDGLKTMRRRRWLVGLACAIGLWPAADAGVAEVKVSAKTRFKVVDDFTGGIEGRFQDGELTKAADGVLYGVLASGGSQDCGTIYKVEPGTGITVVHDFSDSALGCGPVGKLLLLADGHLYGTAVRGGARGSGVVYRFGSSAGYAVVADFAESGASSPLGELREGQDGLLYGTSYSAADSPGGAIFSVSLQGQIKVLHKFNGSDGETPHGELLQLPDGSLVGTTRYGGRDGLGVIFRNDRHGRHVLLHEFRRAKTGPIPYKTGYAPASGLTVGSDGGLYGTAAGGGKHGDGVAYRMDADGGNFQVIHHFEQATGKQPLGRLTLASDGKLLGTTSLGGSRDTVIGGVVFSLDATGDYRVHVRLLDDARGHWPDAGVTDNGNGTFYGLTKSAGQYDFGTVFKFAYP